LEEPFVSKLQLRIFDGTRQPFAAPAKFLVTITDGSQTQHIRNYYEVNDVAFDLPFRCGESWLGSDPILKMLGARRSLSHSCQKSTPVDSWDCIPKPFNASPARESFRLFAWGVIGVFVPVA
jgi:hypothetical protein